MKYCCYDFEAYAKVASTTTPNIKIVKFKPLVKGEENQNFGFYCLSGYETFSIFLPKLNLRFCPFCGTELNRYYRDIGFVNEIEGETFNI